MASVNQAIFLESLPDDVLLLILSYIPAHERWKNVAMVSKKMFWFATEPRILTHLHVEVDENVESGLKNILVDSKWLKVLNITVSTSLNSKLRSLLRYSNQCHEWGGCREDVDDALSMYWRKSIGSEINVIYDIFKSNFLALLAMIAMFSTTLEELTIDYIKFFRITQFMESSDPTVSMDGEVFTAISKISSLRSLNIQVAISAVIFDLMMTVDFLKQLRVLNLKFNDKEETESGGDLDSPGY